MIAAPSRPVMRYHGGKWLLAPWIIGHFPPHRTYVEPFGGAASVLMQKARAYHEVYNDLDSEVVNLFRVLRSPKMAGRLRRACLLTAFARDEFRMAYEPAEDPVERARRLIVRSAFAIGTMPGGRLRSTGWRAVTRTTGTSVAQDWRRWPEGVGEYVERLRGVAIENRPALEVIQQQDHVETLFYADPPYPTGTRGEHRYGHDLTDDDHRQLAAALRSARGFVVVSGYPCDLYDRDLYADWQRAERESRADGARSRTEVLWLSPRTAAAMAGRQERWLA